ncbi:MAG: hypothetical protein II155_00205 [Clostridia bacterium]|jgi:ribosomal protein S27E|nr:hypothetical protein [Clostridia bacterium]
MDFKEKLRRFLAGRYGGDPLNTVISVFSLVALVAAVIVVSVFRSPAGTIIGVVMYLVSLGALVLSIFRTFSRNLSARRAEYEWFRTRFIDPFKKGSAKRKARKAQSATHKFFKCPACRQTVRVPKGKGKIRITCPKCGKTFIKKT